MHKFQKMEPMSQEDEHQYMLMPIRRPDLMEMFKRQQENLWTVEEIDFAADHASWLTMNEDEQQYIAVTLAWFANADNAVCKNLLERFMQEIHFPEAKGFFAIQAYIEFVHVQTYNMCILAVIPDTQKQNELLAAVKTNPIVKPKFEMMQKWIDSDASLGQRLVAFAFVEGVFFSSSFASLYWLRKQGKLPGVCFANEKIFWDECLHVIFAAVLYRKYIVHKLKQETVHAMAKDFVRLEHRFVEEACPKMLRGMNPHLMKQYVERVADTILELLGYDTLFKVQNPFEWMAQIGLMGKSNFFEKRVAEYPNSVSSNMDSVVIEFNF